jgi:hypothetical protein
MSGSSECGAREDDMPRRGLLTLHVPPRDLDAPSCDRCGKSVAKVYSLGWGWACDPCFDRAIEKLRNLPSAKGSGP